VVYDNRRGVGGNCCISGIKDSLGSANRYYHNTTYNNEFSEIQITNDSGSGPILRNNLFYSAAGGHGAIFANGATGQAADVDYNLVFGVTPLYNFAGKWYGTKESFNAATGKGLHDVSGDPLFTNAAAADFSLRRGSAAWAAGVYIPAISPQDPPNIGAK
jgi:hypothetical protein